MYLRGESCLVGPGSTPIRKGVRNRNAWTWKIEIRECSSLRLQELSIMQSAYVDWNTYVRRSSSDRSMSYPWLHLADIGSKAFLYGGCSLSQRYREPCDVSLPESARNGVKGSSASGVEIWPVAYSHSPLFRRCLTALLLQQLFQLRWWKHGT